MPVIKVNTVGVAALKVSVGNVKLKTGECYSDLNRVKNNLDWEVKAKSNISDRIVNLQNRVNIQEEKLASLTRVMDTVINNFSEKDQYLSREAKELVYNMALCHVLGMIPINAAILGPGGSLALNALNMINGLFSSNPIGPVPVTALDKIKEFLGDAKSGVDIAKKIRKVFKVGSVFIDGWKGAIPALTKADVLKSVGKAFGGPGCSTFLDKSGAFLNIAGGVIHVGSELVNNIKNGKSASYVVADVAVETGYQAAKIAAKAAAGKVGTAVGTKIGATIGTAICPGVGTAIGGAIGAAAGYLVTSELAGKAVDAVVNFEIGGKSVKDHVTDFGSKVVGGAAKGVAKAAEGVGKAISGGFKKIGNVFSGKSKASWFK